MTTDNFSFPTADGCHAEGLGAPVRIVANTQTFSLSSIPRPASSTGKVITICGGAVGRISVPYVLQKEIERRKNLVANRGVASSVSTSLRADDD